MDYPPDIAESMRKLRAENKARRERAIQHLKDRAARREIEAVRAETADEQKELLAESLARLRANRSKARGRQ